MSDHYSTREPSGCCGCVAALGLAVGMLGATAYACGMVARALLRSTRERPPRRTTADR